MKSIKITVLLLLFGSIHLNAQNTVSAADEKAVEKAILNYVDALYNVEPEKIEMSVDTTLRKIGYWYDEKNGLYRDNLKMTYQQLYDLAASWNSNGDRINENSPKEIKIYEVNDKTAIAKLTAEWGIDIFHLAKVNGEWKIFNIIWQSHPQ